MLRGKKNNAVEHFLSIVNIGINYERISREIDADGQLLDKLDFFAQNGRRPCNRPVVLFGQKSKVPYFLGKRL